MTIAKNTIVMVANELTGNSGTAPGLITTDVNSAPAKLLPPKFSNAMTIGHMESSEIGTSIVLS
jgi:hypothetical protein